MMLGGGRSEEFPDGASGATGMLLVLGRTEFDEILSRFYYCTLTVEREVLDVWAASFTFRDGRDCPYTESGSGSCESEDFWLECGMDDIVCTVLGLEMAFPKSVGGGTDDCVSNEYFWLKSDVV